MGGNHDLHPSTKNGHLPSLKLTWPLKIDPWKRRFLLETTIFRCYVSFRKGNDVFLGSSHWGFQSLNPIGSRLFDPFEINFDPAKIPPKTFFLPVGCVREIPTYTQQKNMFVFFVGWGRSFEIDWIEPVGIHIRLEVTMNFRLDQDRWNFIQLPTNRKFTNFQWAGHPWGTKSRLYINGYLWNPQAPTLTPNTESLKKYGNGMGPADMGRGVPCAWGKNMENSRKHNQPEGCCKGMNPVITPWKINGWNIQIIYLERKMIGTKPLWLCSMLIFQGV